MHSMERVVFGFEKYNIVSIEDVGDAVRYVPIPNEFLHSPPC